MEFLLRDLKKGHFLTKFDARIKILVAAFSLLLILSYKGFLFPIIIILISIAFCMTMRVPMKVFLLRYSEPAFIALILLILKLFFSGTEPLFSLDLKILTITGYKDGLIEGLILALRILAAVSVIILLGLSTPFTEIMAGLSWFKVPKTLIEIMMFAYRYIFVLLEDAMVIYNAQKNRLGYSNIKRGISSFSTLVGTLVLKAFEHSQKTTTAMIQRGYDGNMPFLKHNPLKNNEIIISILFITTLSVIWKI